MTLEAARRALLALDLTERDLEPEAGAELPRIQGYVIDRRLGGGGSSDVYRAVRTGSDRLVALKLLRQHLGETPETRRAWRELYVLDQLRHPSIPRLLDHGVHDGRMYLVTELVDGHPLLDYCEARSLDRAARVELLGRIADAVQALHEQGVIHRDIKPSNVVVDRQGHAMVIDLGIATLLSRDVMETLTVAGAPIGSPAFMAPEQARGERASTRSDVYGLGATGYVLLTGQTPHDMDATVHEAIRRVAQDPPRHPRELDPQLPKPLAAVLAKAVACRPGDRYASAAEFAADLRRWLSREPVEAGGLSLAHRIGRTFGRHPVAATAAGCIAVAVLTVAATWVSVWWTNTMPYKARIDPNDQSSAQLLSFSNRVLHKWDTLRAGGVINARVLDRPSEFGGGRVVLLGFGNHVDRSLAKQICLFDLDDPETLLWSSGTGPPDIVMPEPISMVKSNAVRLRLVWRGDVFPSSPGYELIAIHESEVWSPSVFRVYSLRGEVLYEFWHDGRINDLAWMAGPRLFVFCAYNSEGNWTHRGLPASDVRKLPWPVVVFAVRPVLGEVHRWVRTPGGRGTFDPLWYRCLMPPDQVQALGRGKHFRVNSTALARDRVDFAVAADDSFAAAVNFTLDASGQVVERFPSDRYKLQEGLPDAEAFYFDDLPPLVKSPLEPSGGRDAP